MLLGLGDIGADDFFDACIIGSGPAGITCALTLLSSGKRILLLEGGDSDITPESQSLYEGTTIGDEYYPLDVPRLRYFGGTSNHWNGQCRTLEEIDFTGKGAYRNTAWPIAKPDLDPYLAEASSILELPEIRQDRPLKDSGLRKVDFVKSPPVRFREKYLGDLTQRANLFVVLKANLVELQTNGTATSGARVVGFDGKEVVVRAGCYILATGGIENSRLLLWSNALSNGALVKNAETLGRYWMEHPHFDLGDAIIISQPPLRMRRNIITYVALTGETMAAEGVLGCTLKLVPPKGEGVEQMFADLACVAPAWVQRALDMVGLAEVCAFKVRVAAEQEPVADNRIELSAEKDALGIPRAALYWHKSETDFKTIRTTARLFGVYLAEQDLGRLRLDDWVLADGVTSDIPPGEGGCHHMGGTRMASTPAEGVVDRDCKVFGQENLYIAGSSVFPSSGYCNPTLSIVQLTLRLGNHLRPKL